MWINCNDTIINLDKVKYLSFEYNEDEVPTVVIHFLGSKTPLILHGNDMEELISYFQSVTIGTEYDDTSTPNTTQR